MQGCQRIVRMYGACLEKPRVCILYELLEGGSLYKVRRKSASRILRALCPAYLSSARCALGAGQFIVGWLQRIYDRLRPPLQLLEVLQIIHDVAEGLAYLHHTADVVHRDLKPHNILLDKHGRAKIIDFGLSKDVANPCHSYLLTDARGTIQYMAPEAFDCKVS